MAAADEIDARSELAPDAEAATSERMEEAEAEPEAARESTALEAPATMLVAAPRRLVTSLAT